MKHKKQCHKPLSAFLIGPKLLIFGAVILCIFQIGCTSRDTGESSAIASSESSQSTEEITLEDIETIESILPDYCENVVKAKEKNDHTVGWLDVPGLGIKDVVVCYPGDRNRYYLRRNFDQRYDFSGVFYADYRSSFGSGAKDELGTNTCIYGHALTDDPDNERYYEKFGALHDLRSENVARYVPYIFFSTERENMAFEIFAVFIANINNKELPYNRNDIEPSEFYKMIKEEVLPRSLYNYHVEIKEDDKFLTLSTCIYVLPDGTSAEYFDIGVYRYAVMAKLVEPDTPLKEEADITVNSDPIIDPKVM